MRKNNCVDVNKATGLYPVDTPLRLMSQEAPYEKTDTRLIVTRQINGEAPTVNYDIKSHVSYTFADEDVISVVKEVTTVRRYVIYSQPTDEDQEEMFQHFNSIKSKGRRRGIVEASSRKTCYSTCCGTPNRRTRDGTCAGCRPNRYPLPQ